MLKPCRQFHVIAVNQKGELIVFYFIEQDIGSTLFDSDDSASFDEEVDHKDEDYEQVFRLNQDTIFEFVDPVTLLE